MIKRQDINIGDHIIESDPDNFTPHPYKGKVTSITETGKGEYDYYVTVRLDEESLNIPYYMKISDNGHINSFGSDIDFVNNNKK